MKKIVVNVTAKDIREGERADCRHCPIARALSRRLGGCPVRVLTHSFMYLRSRAGWAHGKSTLPERAQDFIYSFDMNQEVRPFRFTLNVPSR